MFKAEEGYRVGLRAVQQGLVGMKAITKSQARFSDKYSSSDIDKLARQAYNKVFAGGIINE